CWFEEKGVEQQSLYKPLDFTSKPLAATQHLLSDYDTSLLSDNSPVVRIVFFECLQQSGNGYPDIRQLQRCMQSRDVPIEDFKVKDYLITIDGEENSDAFRSEVKRLKQDNMYQNGTF